MASRNSFHVRTLVTEVNIPAMEESAPSSAVDDERTSARSLNDLRSTQWDFSSFSSDRDSGANPWASSLARDAVAWVVMTNPGRTGSPAPIAAARAAALAPTSEASRDWSAPRVITDGASLAGSPSCGVAVSARDALVLTLAPNSRTDPALDSQKALASACFARSPSVWNAVAEGHTK